jgi:methylenetetrahydrofolate dehydrogenase (NADP+)/methenyltetrahydrofolate cyclohydrolase
MPAQILDGRAIAGKVIEGLKEEVGALKAKGVSPTLASIMVGENPAIEVYIRSQRRAAEEVGIEYQLHKFGAEVSEEELASFIDRLNEDRNVNGIILQLPIPQGLEAATRLQERISPEKDVEGVSPANMGLIVYGRPRFVPCTPAAVMELINSTGVDLYGKRATVVGYSEIVGRPVALLLMDKFCTTSVCRSSTSKRGELRDYVERAEILVVAIGKANLIPGDWIAEGAIVIDCGINRVGDKIVGDVDFEGAKERASFITPVPGGVGPVTTAMLMRNTVEAAKWQLRG